MEKQLPPWRLIVTEALELLSSEAEQLEYERNVPKVDVTAELVCGWSSDAYHPDDPGFVSVFSPEEMEAFAQFDAVLHRHIDHLPPSQGTVQSWLASSSWRTIMHAAKVAHGRIAV